MEGKGQAYFLKMEGKGQAYFFNVANTVVMPLHPSTLNSHDMLHARFAPSTLNSHNLTQTRLHSSRQE